MEFTLGQQVKCTRKYVRESRRSNRKWIAKPSDIKGIVIGKRTVSDGIMDDNDYVPYQHKTAYLVVTQMSRRPVLVPKSFIFATR